MIKLIAAMDRNRNIGANGDMPWGKTMKSDLARFKELTEGEIVVMGRKTFESIGRPLPNRTNILLTRQPKEEMPQTGCVLASSVKEVLDLNHLLLQDIYIIGGADIYAQFMPHADKIYLTKVCAHLPGDTQFPPIIGNWHLYQEEVMHPEGDAYPSQLTIYTKKRG